MRRPQVTPPKAALALLAVVVVVGLWLVRPMWHGFALLFWTSPIVWLPPVVVLLAGGVALRRSTQWRTLEDLQTPRRPDPRLVAFPIIAFVLLVAGSAFNGALIASSLAKNTSFEEIGQLPAGGQVRLVPREVAEQNASSAFNSSTETLTDFRIVRTRGGLQWTALRTPQGLFRTFSKKSQGLVVLDAEQTARSLTQVDERLDVAPGLQVTDNLRWRLLKRHFFVELQDPVGIRTPDGVKIMVPYVERKGIFVRRPVLGGVFVVSADGSIEDLEPGEAAKRPELAGTGRIYPDTLARTVQDSYAYKKGIFNKLFVHEDQTQITDTALNRQPYLIDFAGRNGLGPQWVTVAEPYGRAFAASAIFLTDAVTGKVRIWKVPPGRSLSGNRRALESVRAVSIPGVDFGQGPGGGGNFRVVEPRPVFVRGRLVYLTSIIPVSANSVSKTVVVDAETNKLVQVFNNDTDRNAERDTQTYLQTGRLPDGSTSDGAAGAEPASGATGAGGTGATGSTGSTGSGGGGAGRSVDDQLERLLDRQRELLEDTEALREALRRERGAGGG
ncbi:MAG: hypothetical protein JWO90_3084 [Solirubrobacterales bacterium]|jgi:hypothetical protein|nr:hypothetical protein [Solirubrobacterales bacterium]